MAKNPVAIVILAAGQGSRMQSDLPKVLHRLAGVPLVGHALAAARSLDPEQITVVAGHGADQVRRAVAGLEPDARIVLQTEQLGTGHAVRQALPELEGFEGKVIVLYGDTPFIGEDTLAAMASPESCSRCDAQHRTGSPMAPSSPPSMSTTASPALRRCTPAKWTTSSPASEITSATSGSGDGAPSTMKSHVRDIT